MNPVATTPEDRPRAASTSSRPTVTAVLPVYRNRDTLVELRDRLAAAIEGAGEVPEILYINDVCPEDSLATLERLAREDPRVAVLALAENVGQHRAVLAGMAHARGDWVVVMDADLQDPPEAVPALLALGREGFDVVFAGRRGMYQSAGRLATSRVFKTLLGWLCGLPTDAGMFMIMTRPAAERVLAMGGANPSVVAMVGCAGLRITSVPVTRAVRPRGTSAYTGAGRLLAARRALFWALRWKLGPRPAARPEAPVSRLIGARFRHGDPHDLAC